MVATYMQECGGRNPYFFYFILLCELRMQRLYIGGGGFTQLQTNT